jgi:carbamoyl-phosphate synthase large subunit
MAISRTFEDALLKAITSLEVKLEGLRVDSISRLDDEALRRKIDACDDERLFAIAEALRRGTDAEALYRQTRVDPWFLSKLANIVRIEKALESEELTVDLLREAEQTGFIDNEILRLSGVPREV